ncbi:hypothetical protein DM860_012257 [Cuscuta australis]|uniref:Uncharacterized protein n=1 Tax=Cuscuta australis TaxID=267555 RepID=A0A328E6U7_9ASTE|nr:hypothetical protein DM860_012257 [Cuscuta australis]
MDVETKPPISTEAVAAAATKRPREADENGDALKKAVGEDNVSGPVTVGPKRFGSSVEMFRYFHRLLSSWSPNVNVNRYEHMVLLELIGKGHPEPERKIGCGAGGFQVRFHPKFNEKCFFILRKDGTTDDFSIRKCVDNILPLPRNTAKRGGGGKRAGRGRGHGGGQNVEKVIESN